MTGKIYSSLFLSIFFHGLFILLLIFSVRNTVKDLKNLTYVTLIQETTNTLDSSTKEQKTQETTFPERQKKIEEKSNPKASKITRQEEQLLRERLDALRAKRKILEKTQAGSIEFKGQQNIKGEVVSPSYLAVISGLIRNQWNIPETVPKNLEAVISIRILPNGQIVIEGFEKSSGNTLFDSSVIRALRNSSPLPPPKAEVLVGLRFKP
ncbi:MAG: TonB C-terminal domain-containing protein [Thermodesulfovibrio sp.]|nr:TonB C-terminal domain-containing protein [Thermodesulfovibrio sp.]MDW7998653.1 TonB C-terminal domain-containing protein [Thermodesulfovibrio sp.]